MIGAGSHHPVDWEAPEHPLARREPRRGRRAILAAAVHVPGRPPLSVYNLHLEVFCGVLARMVQFGDVLRDVKERLRQGHSHHVAVLGDLNTMAHGIARLSPNYCCDSMRFWSLGLYEAQVWQRHLLLVPDPALDPQHDAHRRPTSFGLTARAAAPGGAERQAPSAQVQGSGGGRDGAGVEAAAGGSRGVSSSSSAGSGGSSAVGSVGGGTAAAQVVAAVVCNQQLLRHGLSRELCELLTNPGLVDPFDVVHDVTLDNPAYRLWGVSLMSGKLDWVLLRRMNVVARRAGNHDYALSDHKWLEVEAHFG